MAWVATAVTAYGAVSSARANNKAMNVAKDNARRKYELESGVANNQMEEQQQLAVEKMTDVTRAFIQAKAKAGAMQAETMVSGVTADRIKANTRSKFSEATGKVAKEIDTNVVNIAQGMLASKINTEAAIAEAESRKKNVFTETAIGAFGGYQLGSSIDFGSSVDTGAKQTTTT